MPALPAAWVQVPVALQTSTVQTLLSLVHGLPEGSNWQVGEQQSPAVWLPSSHCSPADTTWSPQVPGGAVVLVVVPTTMVEVVVDVVVVAGQFRQQGSVGSSWIVAGGWTTACNPIEGAGAIRYVSRFFSVARNIPLMVMVELARTTLVPAGSVPGPCADTMPDR